MRLSRFPIATTKETPADAEIVTWMGMAHDIPLLISGCMRHGLTLPKGWGWLAHGGFHRERHLDLADRLGVQIGVGHDGRAVTVLGPGNHGDDQDRRVDPPLGQSARNGDGGGQVTGGRAHEGSP